MLTDLPLTLIVGPETQDGYVRLDPIDMKMMGVQPGDMIAPDGQRRAILRVQPALMDDRNQRLARVSELTARNLGLEQGQTIRFAGEKIRLPQAELVTLQARDDLDRLHLWVRRREMATFWADRALCVGEEIRVPTLDRHHLTVRVVGTQPAGAVVLSPSTVFAVEGADERVKLPVLGGLRDIYRSCHALALARLNKTEDNTAAAILLSGSAGCGKAHLAKRLAADLDCTLRVFDVHQLLDQWLAQGGLDLGLSLTDMAKRGPTLVVLDHLEALEAAHTGDSRLDVAAHAVTSMICDMLEEVVTQPDIMICGISSGPLPPRFSKERLFDIVLSIDAPNRWGRYEILTLAARSRSVEPDVDFEALAALSGGLTARDLIRMVAEADLMSGKRKIAQADLIRAFRAYAPASPGAVICDIPDMPWDDVAGLEDVKPILRETLAWSLVYHETFSALGVKPPRSILLSGGRGTGKTSLVRALASSVPMNFIEIGCPYLVTRTQEEGSQVLRDVFALARRKAPCMVFFDDIDALFEGANDPETAAFAHPVVAQLMAELDALPTLPGVVVIGATNRPDRLTNEILNPGRFDFALTLPMPDFAARKKILHIHARKLPLAADVDFERLASLTQGLSPAEIAALCNRVGVMAIRQSLAGLEGGAIPPIVTAEMFEQALRGRKAG